MWFSIGRRRVLTDEGGMVCTERAGLSGSWVPPWSRGAHGGLLGRGWCARRRGSPHTVGGR
nr:MAG TPA: hypothetical protein [Caudoviricetes sp.]